MMISSFLYLTQLEAPINLWIFLIKNTAKASDALTRNKIPKAVTELFLEIET